MKSYIKIISILFFGIHCANAQDSVIIISPKMFSPNNEISIATMDVWRFKEGNDSSWSKKDLDITEWKKIKPADLNISYADKYGHIEGWFKTKIKVDSFLGNKALNLFYESWASSDVYLDGEWIHSFGNTGKNGKPFSEFNPYNNPPFSLFMSSGSEHVLAIHFVDKLSFIPKNNFKGPIQMSIWDDKTKSDYEKSLKEHSKYSILIIGIGLLLCLLFWLLAFLNLQEKILIFIAISSTTLTLLSIAVFRPFESYDFTMLGYYLFFIVEKLNSVFSILLIVKIFNRKVTNVLIIILILLVIVGISDMFYWNILRNALVNGLILIIYGYYIISSWKSLKGAQWAVVTGLLITIVFIILINASPLLKIADGTTNLKILTGLFLSFPLALLVYIAIRFKEIILEVREKAQEVVELSEEKRQHALNQQKILQEEVSRQTLEIRNTLDNLKSTQSQLIQSEKMASLGELTAGIAHEIQNPLNFVNNFSDVNKELLEELKDEADKGNIDEVKAIANDVIGNEEKINHHGKRADSIVKGMLQHSRKSSGKKEPTDINALCDEYLRLSFHGLRAKDKSFNADLKTDFDESIGKINIIPQDIGRVLLNLYNNAFYAVSKPSNSLKGEQYKPLVSVTTRRLNSPSGDGSIEIRVSDNGNGIPQTIVDKIFQPFFTTKPTGQGTGLGLSLSYDIIKAHGGEIKVETKESEGTTFKIYLPVL